jgi:hypothetical protein
LVCEKYFIFHYQKLQTMHESTKINLEGLNWVFRQPMEKQLAIVSSHLEICQKVIYSLMQSHMNELVGEKHDYNKLDEQARYSRWGYNPGSVRIGNQKLSIQVPRIHDDYD